MIDFSVNINPLGPSKKVIEAAKRALLQSAAYPDCKCRKLREKLADRLRVDEIFSNIARYSGATGVVLGCSLKDGKATLRFSDNGRPYDPTEKPDPDTTQSAEEREVGGLGIFMVKKLMDEVTYEYADGSNILTLVKSL